MDLRERLLLRDGLNRDLVDIVAADLDWVFVTLLRKTNDTPFRIAIYRVPRTHEEVRYVEDFVIERGYLLITGRDPHTVAAAIRPRVDLIDRGGVLRQFAEARTREDKINAVYDAAIVAPQESEPQLSQAFVKAFEDPEPKVRIAAVVAVGYVEWPELKALLPAKAEQDADPDVRSSAAAMIRAMEAPQE